MGKKILLADDSITIQKVLELTFSDEDFDVVTVGNGRLAIERIQEVQPDIVLCDIIMPEKDGYEVCEYVKQNPALAHVPVLLLTGAFEPFDQERAARVGSDGYLAKPFEPQTLISKVKELLSRGPRATTGTGSQAAGARVPGGTPPPLAAPVSGTVPLTPAMAAAAGAGAATAHEPEVTFIPEEPFDRAAANAYAPVIEFTAESLPPEVEASPSEGYYGGAAELSAGPELVAEEGPGGEFAAAPSVYGAEDVLEVEHGGEPAGSTAPPWAAGAAQPPWQESAASAGQAPVFEEVFEEQVEAGLPPVPTREPESIPPMLLEYDAGPQGQYAAFEAQLRPETPAPGRPAAPAPARPGPSAADLFAEEMTEFEPEVAAERPAAAAAPAPSRPSAAPTPVPPGVSFADVASPPAEIEKPMPSLAAGVPVPMDMVAQIAQRVVGQVSEKVIREVAWEILPDLAEALIKKEIERITAELKEP